MGEERSDVAEVVCHRAGHGVRQGGREGKVEICS